jgi:uncharacterized 2Fe-2S/4Fe-4S cluster protein (DUF4445 family)
MCILTVRSASGELRLHAGVGENVRDLLDTTALRVRAACGGTGSCGACLIRLIEGKVTPPALTEYTKLSTEERAAGLRLACQMRLQGDAIVELDQPAPPSPWKSLPAENLALAPGCLPELSEHIFGLAVDLGTTHVRVSLWDRKQGRRIACRHGANPQGMHGADVLNRLAAAQGRPDRRRELADLAREAIVDAVRDMLARDLGEVSPMLAEIGAVMVVGNTAMLALLTGRGIEPLLDSDQWQSAIDCRPADPAAWRAGWPLPHAAIELLAPVAGFVGSDLLADLLATRFTDGPPGSLLLDIGTNTELALWDGHTLHVTSVPGGPAFEAVGLCHGMPAEAGAISRVIRAGPDRRLDVIGGQAARGYCGTGLIDAIAVLRAEGLLKPSGRFVESPGPDGYRLDPAQPGSALSGADVDAFQRAKAATAAAIQVLLHEAGLAQADLRRLCVCGAFGRHLDIGNAHALGLLPAVAAERVELWADASLAGCERLLLVPSAREELSTLLSRIILRNMSLVIDFDRRYIDQLRLLPISS